MRVTIDLDPQLFRAVKSEAARSHTSVRAILEEAVEVWLAAAEEREDREASSTALAGYQRSGGTWAEALFGTLAPGSKSS
jgi:hypothetical protein